MMVTTVTREVYRITYNGTWLDAAGRFTYDGTWLDAAGRWREPAPAQVAMMTLGEPIDHETFMVHVRLGNDGVTMKDGYIQHYFESEDILLDLMDLWSRDCTFRTVQHVEVIWDKRGEAP